jgi:hypothetical protein
MPAVRQLANPTKTYSTGVASSRRGEDLGWSASNQTFFAMLILTEASAFYRRVAVRTVLPLTSSAPLELSSLRRLVSASRAGKSRDINTVVDRFRIRTSVPPS